MPILTALAQIIAPLKNEQINRHASMATLDRDTHQQQLDQLRAERLAYREGETLPDATHLAYYCQQIAGIQNELKPILLLENPSRGRFTLAIGKTADSNLMAVFELPILDERVYVSKPGVIL